MTSRQRFAETMRFGRPDRVPYFEEGLREPVRAQWRAQGLADDADLSQMFHIDRREQVPVDLEPRPRLRRWPTTRRGLRAFSRRLDPDDPARLGDDWPGRVRRWRARDHVLQLAVHRGFFLSLGVGDWRRFIEVMHLLHDDPALVEEMLAIQGEFSARLAERVLRDVEIDFATFSEPVGGNDRPLLSPRTYERFVLRSYAPALDVLRRRGVATIVFLTYANARALLSSALEAGFNCLWACEVESDAMDYRSLRREFGRSLRLIGGIDLDVLLRSKEAIRRELETKLPVLLEQGGYVPLADGRVRENVPLDSYVYYRRLLEEMTRQ